uniref:Phage tail fiber protein n=1 Tax=Vibrio tasmaniensis TaxID=212663 RepID=A0A0H3ZQL7_9VIBR|nr:Phage tail fiber protein [Vibrio tasmaniensis]
MGEEKEHQKVTAYLKSNGTESKEFGDKTLVTDNYTLESPSTQWDEWNGTAWVTNQSNKHIAEYNQADSARRAAYREVSDPLYMEALRQESRGLTDEAAEYRAQADAAVELIKLNLPWPEPLTN